MKQWIARVLEEERQRVRVCVRETERGREERDREQTVDSREIIYMKDEPSEVVCLSVASGNGCKRSRNPFWAAGNVALGQTLRNDE